MIHAGAKGLSSTNITGMQSYTASLKLSISVQLPGWNSSFLEPFSASSDYKDVEEETTKHSFVYTEASARTAVYQLMSQPNQPPQASANFVSGIHALPLNYSDENASAFTFFIDTFGTHVMYGAQFGGIWGQTSKFTRTAWKTLSRDLKELKLAVTAKKSLDLAAGLDVGLGGGWNDTQIFINAATDQKTFSKGGRYASTSEEWRSSVRKEPMPIYYYLWSLDKILEPWFMPSSVDTDVLAAKRDALQIALKAYCSSLVEMGTVSSCDEPPADSPVEVHQEVDLDPIAEWQPHGSSVTYELHKCPPGSYITEMRWKELEGYGLVDLFAKCSDTVGTSFHWFDVDVDKSKELAWDSIIECPNGISVIHAKERRNYGLVNAGATCAGDAEMQFANLYSKGEWLTQLACPHDTPVLAGLNIETKNRYGIVNLQTRCSNAKPSSSLI